MNTPLSAEYLSSVGLRGGVVVESGELAPRGGVNLTWSETRDWRAIIARATRLELVRLSSPVADRCGLSLSSLLAAPDVVFLQCDPPYGLHVSPGARGRLGDTPQTLFVDLSGEDTVVVQSDPAMPVLLVRVEKDGHKGLFAVELPAVSRPRAKAPFEPPFGEWLAADAPPHLASAVAARASVPDDYTRLVAVGLCALYGSLDVARACRTWARAALEALTSAERARLWIRVRVHGQGCADALDALEHDCEPASATWRDALRALCLDRDDLDAALVVLQAQPPEEHQDAALRTVRALDVEADLFERALPVVVRIDAPRLAAAAVGRPEAWWTRFHR